MTKIGGPTKRCELCGGKARLQCDADEASLCWTCDAKVHSANFLVSRHSRSLLCKSCQSLLPWSAAGGSLTPIVSVCENCACKDAEDDDVEENQVVPASPPPPEDTFSSSGEQARDGDPEDSRKRHRTANPSLEHAGRCSSPSEEKLGIEEKVNIPAATGSKRTTTSSKLLRGG